MLFDDFAVRMDAVPAPQILSLTKNASSGAMEISWLTEALYKYQLQYTDNLSQPWKSDLSGSSTTAAATGTSSPFTDTAATGRSSRFYRVIRTNP